MRVFQPRRSQEKNSESASETPGQKCQKGGDEAFGTFVPGVSSVSEKKLDTQPAPQNLETQRHAPRDTGVSSPVLPMPSPAVENLEPEPIEAEPEDGYQLLPAQSPWLELSDNAQGIWDALEARGTRTLHLLDQNGRKACHAFTASKLSDLKELARRGLKTFPRVQRLTVVAVLPEVQIWQLEPRTVN